MSNLPPSPSRGKPPNKKILYAGGIVAAGIVYWAYKKNKASASTVASTDPNIDPATGQPYSSGYGTTGMGGASGATPSLYGYMDQFGNLITNPGTTTTVTHPTTNGAWVQQASGYLISHGYDPLTVLTALGKYIAGGFGGATVTDDQMGIIQAAIAVEGQPPEPVGNPHLAPPVGQTPPPGPTLPDGYYFYPPTASYWEVAGNVKHHLSPTGWTRANTPVKIHPSTIGPTQFVAFNSIPEGSVI